MRIRRVLSLLAVQFLLAMAIWAQPADPKLLNGYKWRDIGPWRGGRSVAVTGVYGKPNEFYAGFTGGGVWKSTDAGQNWKCVSDGFFKTGSVGAIAVSESNPETVYVGMGETQIRGNISHGDGVYRSDDGGQTWRHLGLASTRYISRVRIHPKNPEIAYVAALGHVYGPHPDRGVYKTTDGGRSWNKVLFVDDRSGAVDLCFDPSNPETLYAATWEAWRTPHSLNSGGPGSKIFKSINGGQSWSELTRNPGLPTTILGKVGLAVSPANPRRVFAMIEAAAGGFYRSDDAGATWKLVNPSPELRQRPWYYTRVYAHPTDENHALVLNVANHRTTNAGERFTQFFAQHSDNHDMWFDPKDPNRMIFGNDGGATVTTDGGRTWTEQDMPTAQFYHVSTDNAFPYRVLGAQQDNSTVRIFSRTFGRGILATDWESTAGGESGYVSAKPDNPDIVFGGNYGGDLEMRDHKMRISRSVDPWPDNPMGSGADVLVQRFQWTYPIIFSPHDPNVLYTCSQFVLMSTDLGASWTKISPDLTTNDKSRQASSGGPITKDNTGVEYYCTVFTLAESPKRRGVLWAGTDDGLIHVSQNGGKNWTNVTPKGMPKWALVSIIEASPHDPAVAYAAVDNHENDDHTPFIYKTSDFGRNWSLITTGIPADDFVRVVREDPERKGLLYAGTETGIYISFDDGKNWQRFNNNLPVVPVHDLTIKDDDIVVATHGRSFWILDDISALRQMGGKAANEAALFEPKPGTPLAFGGQAPEGEPAGKNPAMSGGILIHYYLPADAQTAKVELVDRDGKVVATNESAPKGSGLNRVSLTPRYPSYRGFQGMRMWSGGPGTLRAPPGSYTVRLTVDGKEMKTRAIWARDPRTSATDADLVEQYNLSVQIAARTDQANRTVESVRDLRAKVEAAVKDNASLTAAAQPFLANITAVEEAIYQTKAQSGQDFLNYPIRLNNKLAALLGTVQSGPFGPTAQSYEVFEMLSKQLQAQLDAFEKAKREDLAKLNAALKAAGKEEIKP
jgi:photosystem II stability/assembly factor-like uncharacterized protein